MVSKEKQNSKSAVSVSKLGQSTTATKEEPVFNVPKFCLKIAEN